MKVTVSIPKWCDCKWLVGSCMLRLLRFQFQNGAIASSNAIRAYPITLGVSIPKWCDCKPASAERNSFCFAFQFQNGAIASNSVKTSSQVTQRFNSKMVRLQGARSLSVAKPVGVFQFQNGAIARQGFKPNTIRKCPFQFQNGAIASRWICVFQAIQKCFNSKMVRLQVCLIRSKIMGVNMFQFQNGAIARNKLSMINKVTLMFQFQNGAIASSLFFRR